MLFINQGERILNRVGESDNCRWIWIKQGAEVDLPEEEGLKLGLTPIRALEGQIGKSKVETKVIDEKEAISSQDKEFIGELEAIKGIGPKTAKEIAGMYSRGELFSALRNNKEFLLKKFNDNVVERLEEKYGA